MFNIGDIIYPKDLDNISFSKDAEFIKDCIEANGLIIKKIDKTYYFTLRADLKNRRGYRDEDNQYWFLNIQYTDEFKVINREPIRSRLDLISI
jgi:hypothetical protein